LGSTAGKGYLILPGEPPYPLDARFFAHLLGKTQLLFLSSCRSSEEAFAFEMARNYVPAVLGFRWEVDDSLVPDFVQSFYRNLFRNKSIDLAFVAARKAVRELHGVKSQIWAAPMLVLQQPPQSDNIAASAVA
jgi:hypothetical protein